MRGAGGSGRRRGTRVRGRQQRDTREARRQRVAGSGRQVAGGVLKRARGEETERRRGPVGVDRWFGRKFVRGFFAKTTIRQPFRAGGSILFPAIRSLSNDPAIFLVVRSACLRSCYYCSHATHYSICSRNPKDRPIIVFLLKPPLHPPRTNTSSSQLEQVQ
jgi:hypothetical protein